MNLKVKILSKFIHAVSTTLYMMGFLFLCTVVYFNHFQFNQPSDSKQYVLPFLIMFFSWVFICFTEIFEMLLVQDQYESLRQFFSHHILFILFLGGHYLWSKGAQLFMLNHLIIFAIGIYTFYKCIQQMLSFIDTPSKNDKIRIDNNH